MPKYLDSDGVSYLWSKFKNIQSDKLIYHTKTVEEWNINPNLISEKDVLYIYSDYKKKQKDGKEIVIPGIKMGDGKGYLIDLPFLNDINSTFEQILMDHIDNDVVHITQMEREFWNNKLNLSLSDENLILNRR